MISQVQNEYIRSLSKRDAKTLTQRALKLCEESGELAKAVLPFDSTPTTLHRIVTKSKVAEEAVDTLLVALSILHQLEYTDEDIQALVQTKALKWDGILTREGLLDNPSKIPHEIHITVECENYRIDQFKHMCRDLHIKPIVLDLPLADGSTMRDVMTSSHQLSTTSQAIITGDFIASMLHSHDFNVLRVKVETVPWHPNAPQNNTDKLSEGCYFEAHIGVLMDQDSNTSSLEKIADKPGIRLSRNAFKKYDSGVYVQMITVRDNRDRDRFDGKLERLLMELDGYEFKYEKVITEYAVYDTNVTHDKAWIG